MGHESKCAQPHGHNYVAFFQAYATSLDGIGRVIDFSVLKAKLGGWIDETWDHKFLVYEKDRALGDALSSATSGIVSCPFNPTAENMAMYLLSVVAPRELEGTGVVVEKVTLFETENCYAEVTLGETLHS